MTAPGLGRFVDAIKGVVRLASGESLESLTASAPAKPAAADAPCGRQQPAGWRCAVAGPHKECLLTRKDAGP